MPMIICQAISYGTTEWPRKKLLEWFEFRPLAEGEREQFPEEVWEYLEQREYPDWVCGPDFVHETELGTCIEIDAPKAQPLPGGERVPAHATLGTRGVLNITGRMFLDKAREQS